MKKTDGIIIAFIAVAFPVLLFMNIFQVYRTQKLEKEISLLEEQRKELVEMNRQMEAAIALISSPERIAALTEHSDDDKERQDPVFISVGQE